MARPYKLTKERISLYVGKMSFELYWPVFYAGNRKQYGFYAKTMLVWRPEFDWKWNWALAATLLGFGFGICHNHVDNPNYEYTPPDPDNA